MSHKQRSSGRRQQANAAPPSGRLWALRLTAVLLGLLPFVVIEGALRLTQPAGVEAVDEDPLVDLEQLEPLFTLDPATGRRSIPASRMNFFRPASFPAVKAASTRRIFVLGGSTVQGRPFGTETAFSTWLDLHLKAADPSATFEVVNCGGVSYASYRVARILDEVLDYQPDAIVLYTGHNEFLEDRTYADVRTLGPARRWLSRQTADLRTVRWLQRLLQPSGERTVIASEVDARLDRPGGLDRYRRDPGWQRGVEAHFEQTLERMVRSVRRRGIPLVVCLPAADLVGTPPFKSTMLESLDDGQRSRFESAWRVACHIATAREERLEACRICLQIDPQHAAAAFLAGRLRYDDRDAAAALPYLVDARDHDVCPLRATSAILRSIRRVTQDHGVPLVDAEVLLDRYDADGTPRPDGVADPSLFVDHVHPTIAGHQRIAEQLAAELTRLGLVEPQASEQAVRARYQQLVTEHLATLGEPYYARGKQRLAGLKLWTQGRAGAIGIDPQD